MNCPVFNKGVSPLLFKRSGEVLGVCGVRFSDGVVDRVRCIKKPFLCSDGVTRQVAWTRRLGRFFVDQIEDKFVLRAAESGMDGSIYHPASARQYVK